MADVMNVYGHEGGFGLVAYHWENHTSLASVHHDGAAWSSGSAGSGSTGIGRGNSLYVPEDMIIAYLVLEARIAGPGTSTDIIQSEAKVALQQVDSGDATDDSDLSTITGTELTLDAITDGSGDRRRTAMMNPDIKLDGGTWIRPVTTAPTVFASGDTNNDYYYTVWLRHR